MGGEVSAVVSAAGEAIVRETSGPHHLGSRVIVVWIVHKDLRVRDHGAHKTFRNGVGDLHISAVCEIALHGMHQNIGAAAGCLVRRESHCDLRVHDSEYRAGDIIVVAAFFQCFIVCDNRAVAHLTSGSRDGQNNADRKACGCLTGVLIEIPDITVVRETVTDGFRGVDDTAAAYRKEKINALLSAELDPLAD